METFSFNSRTRGKKQPQPFKVMIVTTLNPALIRSIDIVITGVLLAPARMSGLKPHVLVWVTFSCI